MEDTKQAISWELCLELANNNADLAHELLTMFVNELDDTRAELQQLFEQQNFQTLKERVHKLHGGACYTGVPQLKHAAKTLEKNLSNNADEQQITQNINKLFDEMQSVLETFNEGSFQ